MRKRKDKKNFERSVMHDYVRSRGMAAETAAAIHGDRSVRREFAEERGKEMLEALLRPTAEDLGKELFE